MSPLSGVTKLIGVAVFVAVVSAACSKRGTDENEAASVGQSAPITVAPSDSKSLPVGPSALNNRFDDAFPSPLIDPAEVVSGGPPPDGIPPIDDPQFVSTLEADEWLGDVTPVLVVDIKGDVRAYPIQILMWHEIVNDTVGGVPLAITYCPLCNSALVFERVVRGVETTFGTSGSLYNANLVMYDRATESLWNQLDGRAVIGVLAGDELTQIPAPTVSWSTLMESRPDAKVLDQNRTGVERAYGTNPYTGLDDPDGQPFLFNGEIDVRAKAMQRIVAIRNDRAAAAWTLDSITDESGAAATPAEFDGEPIAIFWRTGEASALDDTFIVLGRDVGTVAVFSAVVEGATLSFRAVGGSFFDEQTGSEWNVLGEATGGELAGTRLAPVTFVRTFWFSWAAFRPDTELSDGT